MLFKTSSWPKIALAGLFLLSSLALTAQVTVTGKIIDAQSGEPLSGVAVSFTDASTSSDEEGRFRLRIFQETSSATLTFAQPGYRTLERSVRLGRGFYVNLGRVQLMPQESNAGLNPEDVVPIVELSEAEFDGSDIQAVSGLLNASRDVFAASAGFTFGPARFNRMGYDQRYSTIFLNGMPMNDLGSGRAFWSHWGGLNDVFRNRLSTVGLSVAPATFGQVGGTLSFDTRASQQRKQLRVSYASSNRTYNNRVMATYSTGMLPSGWAFTVSGSRRWAEEGFVPGTYYDGYAYFLSVDRQLGKKHTLNFTGFGSPVERGRGGVSTQEMNDLAGTNFYNPNWGFQDGEKRNARVLDAHQPFLILRHDWEFSENTRLTTSAGYQFGYFGTTALDWYDAPDPRPDYYRRLPSFIDNEQSGAVAQRLQQEQALRQIDWNALYEINRHNFATIEDANGIPGNTVTGLRAQYIVEDRHFDTRRMTFNTNLEHIFNPNVTLRGGLTYQDQEVENYKEVEDLLGADFYLDIDKFAEFDSINNPAFFQNNVDVPNRVVEEGDRFGYDFDIRTRQGEGWLQGEFSTALADFFLAGRIGRTEYWREGHMRNGIFPENSLGASEKKSFTTFGGKAGTTVKIDGRNYLQLQGTYQTIAPLARVAFVSPRTRNLFVNGLTEEKVYGAEAAYLLRSPAVKARVTGYYTRFDDRVFNRTFYLDNALITGGDNGLVNYIMTGVDTRHLGVEAAASVKLNPSWRVSAAASVGEYVYVSRPEVEIVFDNNAMESQKQTVFIKNFHVPNTPQQAYSFRLNYSSPNYWFANLTVNYLDDMWIDFNPDRRTRPAISFVENPQYAPQIVDPESELFDEIVRQEKLDPIYTLDFFGGKSWKIGDIYLYLNLGVNNILDDRDLRTGGFEQYRFDYETKDVSTFPNRYFYGFGRTYFASLAFRI